VVEESGSRGYVKGEGVRVEGEGFRVKK